MTWQGVSEAECYDNRSVMAQIMRLKDRVRVLEEGGSEEIEHEIELINEQLTILEGKVGGLEEGAAGLAEDVAALETGKADKSQLTDGSVTKIGTATVGSQTSPIYINQGVPTTTGVKFLKVGTNDIGNSDIELNNNLGLNTVGSLNLKKAELVAPNDVYYRRWPSWKAGATAMWGWEIPIQNEADNAFDMEVDVIRENLYGENYEVYSRFRLTTNGVKQVSIGDDDPPVLKFVCEFGDPSMACVARLTPEHWTTDFTIWRLFIRVNIQSASGNSMPAVRINRVLSKKPIFFPVLPNEMHCQYEDVTYAGETIPNVTNYTYFDWLFPTQQGGGGGGGTYYAGTGLSLANNTFSLDTATQTTLGQVANKADDSAVVKLTGAQTVQGVKTFDSSPIVPTPTTDYEVATKKYVDDNAGGSGTWTAVASDEWTATKFAELFQQEGGANYAVYSALKDVEITIIYWNRIAWTTYIPKGGIVPKDLHFVSMQGTTSSGANYASMVRLDLKEIFTNTSASNVVGCNYPLSGITDSTTTATTVKSKAANITYGDILHQSVMGIFTSNKYNLFIQYR